MRILLHKTFEKKYAKVPAKIQKQFKERRNIFITNPSHPTLNVHPLSGDRDGQWSFNVTSDWRVLYMYVDEDTIIFIDLDTHSNLYT